jgi:hypothetical protein
MMTLLMATGYRKYCEAKIVGCIMARVRRRNNWISILDFNFAANEKRDWHRTSAPVTP